MPTITGRSKTGLFGAILTVAFTGVADMGSSFVLKVCALGGARTRLEANVVPGAGGCKPGLLERPKRQCRIPDCEVGINCVRITKSSMAWTPFVRNREK